ncbi:hypothetical protein B0H11DRAFT_2264463 [Mycena galericulata]|nr:hypothetical protein B0H11DRAFT_2264463 [Mycena galericulata]
MESYRGPRRRARRLMENAPSSASASTSTSTSTSLLVSVHPTPPPSPLRTPSTAPRLGPPRCDLPRPRRPLEPLLPPPPPPPPRPWRPPSPPPQPQPLQQRAARRVRQAPPHPPERPRRFRPRYTRPCVHSRVARDVRHGGALIYGFRPRRGAPHSPITTPAGCGIITPPSAHAPPRPAPSIPLPALIYEHAKPMRAQERGAEAAKRDANDAFAANSNESHHLATLPPIALRLHAPYPTPRLTSRKIVHARSQLQHLGFFPPLQDVAPSAVAALSTPTPLTLRPPSALRERAHRGDHRDQSPRGTAPHDACEKRKSGRAGDTWPRVGAIQTCSAR